MLPLDVTIGGFGISLLLLSRTESEVATELGVSFGEVGLISAENLQTLESLCGLLVDLRLDPKNSDSKVLGSFSRT